MKAGRRKRSSRPFPSAELANLRLRLAEVEATLLAIRSGEVDAVVVAGQAGPQVFTLEGADHAYRVLIESMHEGALTLTTGATILYANQCFARMVKCPLEQVTGSSFHRFLAAADRAAFGLLLEHADKSGAKILVLLHAANGSQMPVQIALRPLVRHGFDRAAIGLVVTDMTEARHTEERLRALTHRVVEVQEAERGHMASQLHDNVTQLLCGVLVHGEALAGRLSSSDPLAKREAHRLCEMLGEAIGEAERISRSLRPSVLSQLGVGPVLRETCREFAARTGLSVELACSKSSPRLPTETDLALYRILQKALGNVERHAHAHHVKVRLIRRRGSVQLTIEDDGIGFDPESARVRRRTRGGLGLLSMRERASYVGGVVNIASTQGSGTRIEIRIPVPGELPLGASGGEPRRLAQAPLRAESRRGRISRPPKP